MPRRFSILYYIQFGLLFSRADIHIFFRSSPSRMNENRHNKEIKKGERRGARQQKQQIKSHPFYNSRRLFIDPPFLPNMKTFWLALRARCANKIREMASRKFLLSGDHMGVTTAISCYFPLFPRLYVVCVKVFISQLYQ